MVAIPVFDIGDAVRLTARFTDPDSGEPVDPTEVELRLRTPSQVLEVYQYPDSIVRVSAGVYRRVIDLEEEGMYSYRFISVGNGKAAQPGRFRVVRNEP